MGIFEKFFGSYQNSVTITNKGIKDDDSEITSISNLLWQKSYALSVVENILASALMNIEWNTFSAKKRIYSDDWFRLNYSPNRNDSASEFYAKLAHQLVYTGRALIVELNGHEVYVADSFNFLQEEQFIKENTFVNVVIGNLTLNKQFKENRNCIYIRLPKYKSVDSLITLIVNEIHSLKALINKGAEKAMGTKLNLQVNSQGANKIDDSYLSNLQKAYLPLMEKPNAVFLTQKGETLIDLTEKQRGSEVEQVLQVANNNVVVDKNLLSKVGTMYGIPNIFMTGDYTQDDSSSYQMLITFFIKPIVKELSQKLTLFYIEKESIILGSKIVGNLDSISFVNALGLASSIDKLISSGAYLTDEVREMLGDDPIEGGDERLITKNYERFREGGVSDD